MRGNMKEKQQLGIPPRPSPNWDLIGGIDPEFRIARFRAVADGRNTFRYFCGACISEELHDIITGACGKCVPIADPTARAAARARGEPRYAGVCDTCGPAAFWTKIGRCSGCHARNGDRRSRAPHPPARRAAIDEGESTYMAGCILHGHVAHHTRRGLCLDCYTTEGKVRDVVYMKHCALCRQVTLHDRKIGCTACPPILPPPRG